MVKLIDVLGLVDDKKQLKIVEFSKMKNGDFGGYPTMWFIGNKSCIMNELGDDYNRYGVLDVIGDTIQIGVENKDDTIAFSV